MDIQQALKRVAEGLDLSRDEMRDVMRQIMTGGADAMQISAFLMGLRMKSESVDEITGAVEVMRELVTPVNVSDLPYLVDIVGTGGDGSNLFNISSASAFVAAAAGCHVAKHGGRSVSSKSGSADVLETAGIKLDLTPEQIAACVREVGVGFMFAPNHHSAMKHAVGPRKALGLRTLFNILGPMTNPAGVQRGVIGVFAKELCRPVADVLAKLGGEHILVVHGMEGLDEISLAAKTHVAEVKQGKVREYTLIPEDVGVESQSLVGLEVTESNESLALIRNAFTERNTKAAQKAADMLALNAGAAIYTSGIASTFKEGVAQATKQIQQGGAAQKLDQLATFTQQLKNA